MTDYAEIQEYLTGNEQIAYPFRDDAEGLCQTEEAPVHGASAKLPRDFLLDLVMLAPASLQGQMYLLSISRSPIDPFRAEFNFGDMSGVLLSGTLDATPAEKSIVELYDTMDRISCRFVTGPGFSNYMAYLLPGGTDTFDYTLPLEAATVEFVPHKLLDLYAALTHMDGEIALHEGYNVQLDSVPADPAVNSHSSLTIIAGPGLGMGLYNPCGAFTPVDYIGTINGRAGNSDGAFQLMAGECYRVLGDKANNMLQIYNDCVPCCGCDSYAAVVAGLKQLFDTMRLASGHLEAGASMLAGDIASWNDDIYPEVMGPTISIGFVSGSQFGVEGQSGSAPNYGTLTISVKNNFTADISASVNVVFPVEPDLVIDSLTKYEGNCCDTSGSSLLSDAEETVVTGPIVLADADPPYQWWSGPFLFPWITIKAKAYYKVTFNCHTKYPDKIGGLAWPDPGKFELAVHYMVGATSKYRYRNLFIIQETP